MEADHSLGLFSTLRVNEVLQRDAADLFSALQRSVTLSVHFLLLLSSSTVDTRRLIVPLCRPLAALISVWVLWEHDIVERAETAVCKGEWVNSIPTAEMAFKCLSLCTPIVLQTHYLSASLCVSTSIRVCACVCLKCISEPFLQSSPCSHATHPLPFRSDLFLIHHASPPVLLPEVSAKV